MTRTALAAGAVLLAAACGPAVYTGADVGTGAPVRLLDAQGENVGSAVFSEAPGGVRLNVNVVGLPPGVHGIHIHETGACEPPDFSSAGGHLNPAGTEHGLQNPQGPHAGDLPNLVVNEEGRGELEVVTDRVTLAEGAPNSLFRPGGTALVIHAGPDDQATSPSGDSGARIACGVISPR